MAGFATVPISFPQNNHVQWQNVDAPDSYRTLATEGMGTTLMDTLRRSNLIDTNAQFNQAQRQTMGSFGARGLYDSSLHNNAQAGLVATRQGSLSSYDNQLTERNRQLMLQGQQLLQNVNQFNQQGAFQADQFNTRMDFDVKSHNERMRLERQKLDMMRDASKRNFFASLMSVGAPLMATMNPWGIGIGAGLSAIGAGGMNG